LVCCPANRRVRGVLELPGLAGLQQTIHVAVAHVERPLSTGAGLKGVPPALSSLTDTFLIGTLLPTAVTS